MPSSANREDALSADRQALLDLWLSRDEAENGAGTAPFAPPRSERESVLANIWQEVLDVEQVGIDDDYFSIGGDSILAIVVVTRAQEAGVPISTHDLFEAPTIRKLAELSQPDASGPVPARIDPGRAGALPLTPLQAGMLYHALDDPSAYVVQATCRLEGDINVGELAQAWQVIVDRHPELRTSFRVGASGPEQVTASHADVPVEIADWRQPGGEPLSPLLRQYLARDRARGIDPAIAPLLRIALLRLTGSAYHCVFTHHHLLLDGWSQQLVLAELLDVYDQLGEGAIRPAPARLPFAAYLDWLGRQDLPAAEAFWREQLRGFSPAPAESLGAGGAGDSGPGGYELAEAVLPPAASAGLVKAGQRLGLTLSTIVLGGWALLLGHLSQTTDVAFGVTVAGRPPDLPGVDQSLGMFINTLPARIRIHPADRPAGWLRSIQIAQGSMSRYQYSPLTLVERCADTQPGTRLFDSIVVVENFPTVIREEHMSRRLRITGATASVIEGYPMVLDVRPGDAVRLRLRYDTRLVSSATAAAALDTMSEYLSAVADPPGQVAELSAGIGDAMARHVAAQREQARSATAGRLRGARREPADGPAGER
jgi:nonribosomal peptide synthetase protein BlmV